MPLTQESEVNKNYQALGMDEVARDIENIIAQVNTNTEDIASLGGYTETIVNISSAQILAMGSSPIELLPAPGSSKYYELQKVVLEYTHNSTAYTPPINDAYGVIYEADYSGFYIAESFMNSARSEVVVAFVQSPDVVFNIGTNVATITPFRLNQKLVFTTWAGGSPTLGDGTLRVKIYHKTITFGA